MVTDVLAFADEGDADKMAEKLEPGTVSSGRNPLGAVWGASNISEVQGWHESGAALQLMEAVVARDNMWAAYERVVRNKGTSGIDEMTLSDLKPHLQANWLQIKEDLLAGRYIPQPVRGVEIPKPSGKGKRLLGIPVVVDRLIQQALLQVLTPVFDPYFSENSYGFRPGRSAHQAVRKARQYVRSGRRFVVDMDLEKFFDRVNHDILMARVARRVKDPRVLQLIRRFLRAGIMANGVIARRERGTPQGGPLSPLLANILLDDLDKELERRGHCFCRYADDSNIYVRSRRAGERVMESVSRFLEERLKLQVNRAKSAVDRPWNRKFLGYSMTHHHKARLKVAKEAVRRFRANLKEVFRRGRGRSLARTIETLTPIMRGWINYFALSEVKGVFDELDGWVRRKLRCILWRQWKRTYTRAKNLIKRGLDRGRALKSAMNGRGPWWNAGASHMNQALPAKYFDHMGLVSLLQMHRRLSANL